MKIEISKEELVEAGIVDARCPVARDDSAPDPTMPIIGIVPTYKPQDKSLELPERYVRAVAAAGAAPIVLPFSSDVAIYETLLPNLDGFLLSGGQDIDPVRYGEAITFGKAEEISPDREEVEYLILSFARQYDVPVLGICRGMQMINVAFGGTLWQDLGREAEREGHWQTEDYATPTHRVALDPASKLGGILGVESAFVNSMHHQGIRTLAPGLRAAARGEDELIEAVEAPGCAFMIGVQWHPEFFASRADPDRRDGAACMERLFDALVEAAARKRCRDQRCRACLRILREECGGCFPSIKFDN